jgi:hypothetical protein
MDGSIPKEIVAVRLLPRARARVARASFPARPRRFDARARNGAKRETTIDRSISRPPNSHWSPYDRVRVVNADP